MQDVAYRRAEVYFADFLDLDARHPLVHLTTIVNRVRKYFEWMSYDRGMTRRVMTMVASGCERFIGWHGPIRNILRQ